MAKIVSVQEISINDIVPYENNAKIHGREQIEKLKESILEFGFLTPCLIDEDNNLIAGHGRVMAAKELGFETVPCVYIEGLTEEQRRAYILADNRLSELGEWDMDAVNIELQELDRLGFNFAVTGFDSIMELADFDEEAKAIRETSRYTGKVNIPQYEPTGEEVDTDDCVDLEKTYELMEEIDEANLPKDIADFLKVAAYRHAVFNYRNIAELYANSSPKIQELMEKSALVIIDVDDAIANGYVKLSKTINDILSEVEDDGE